MATLAQTQKSFAHALLDHSAPAPRDMRGTHSERRFAIYRNNVAMGLFSALSARYPVVKRLVGDEFFGELSRRYIAVAPPRSPIMLCYGETFPDFINKFEAARPVPYLAAVARIEMARGLAYHAADATPIGANDFAALPPRQLAELRLTLHPSVSVVASPYPIFSIWNVNQSRAPVVPVMPWAAEAALIARPVHAVEVTKLRTGEAIFLQTLAQGDTVAEAFDAALADAPSFDVAQGLALLIKARIVTGFGRRTRIVAAN
jgi:hypothetical protein